MRKMPWQHLTDTKNVHASIDPKYGETEVKTIGTRHGEKLYETLVTREEMAKAVVEGAKEKGAEVVLVHCSDFSAADVAAYDAIAFGCPAMGAEVLEESEFQPMFDEVSTVLGGKKIALFATSGGTGIEKSVSDLKAGYPELNIVGGKRFTFSSDSDIKIWL